MTLMRRGLGVAFWLLLATSAVAVLVIHLAPVTGVRPLAIRSGSMAPAIPVGSLVVAVPDVASKVAAGDVVTVTTGSNQLVTHRVTRVMDAADGPRLELRGDANAAPDPALVPPGQVVGRVAVVIPVLGFVLAALTSPAGMVAILSFAGALGVARSLLPVTDPPHVSRSVGRAQPTVDAG